MFSMGHWNSKERWKAYGARQELGVQAIAGLAAGAGHTVVLRCKKLSKCDLSTPAYGLSTLCCPLATTTEHRNRMGDSSAATSTEHRNRTGDSSAASHLQDFSCVSEEFAFSYKDM